MSDMQQPYYQPQPKPRSRWWIPFAIIASIVGGMFIMVIIIGVGIASFIGKSADGFGSSESDKVKVEDNSVLSLNFGQGGVHEYVAASSPFGGNKEGVALLDVLTAIHAAKDDPKIRGIYYRPSGSVGFAKQREIIAALEDFKSSKKFIVAFLPGGSEKEYYFAAVADSIYMPQEATFEFNGFGGTSLFLKDMFEKIGVEWTVIQREDYKSAGEMFNRTKYSEPARQEAHELLDQRAAIYTKEIARLRHLSPETVNALLSRGLYDPDSLLANHLIDNFATDMQVREKLKSLVYGSDSAKKKVHMVDIKSYASYARAHNKAPLEKDKQIAIVYGSGSIRSGSRSGMNEEIASASWVRDLRRAADDDDISAIILRIDSPGGSVQASDEMYHEILRAKAKKPVYASMSDVAASGGYYMAMACDTIIAYPETITGSIGVIAAIPNFSKTMTKLGVGIDTISSSPAALFMNPLMPMSDRDHQHLENLIQSFYQRFLERAAAGRHTTPEKIREVAKGRVWSGEAAKAHGLVDVLGGLYTSIDLVKKRIGVSAEKRVRIVSYPEKEDGVKVLLRLLDINSGDDDESDDGDEESALAFNIPAAVDAYVKAQSPQWQDAWKALPDGLREQAVYALNVALISRKEQVLATLPWTIDMR